MDSESTLQPNKTGVLTTAIGLSLFLSACLSLTACKEVAPPALNKLPGVTATPSVVTVAEDDSSTFEVVLDSEPKANVTITVKSLDTTEATTDVAELTFTKSKGDSPWNVAQTVTVNGVNDTEPDGNQAINIVLGIKQVLNVLEHVDTDYNALAPTNVVTTVTDISAAGFTISASTLATTENGAGQSYTVVLNTQPSDDVVIDVASEDISEGTVDKAMLAFNALDWQIAQAVTVASVDDLKADGNQRYNVSMAVNGAGTADTSGYADLTLPPVVVTNADDDVAGFTVSATTLGTKENGAAQSYTVVLNTEPGDSVVVDVTSLNTDEGTVAPATLTFGTGDWQIAQTVSVSPVDDFVMDGNQIYDVSMVVNAANTFDNTGYADLFLAPVVVTNADNDVAGFTVSASTLDTVENGTTTGYTVVLNTQPDNDVVIAVVSEDISEGTVDKAILTFNALDWQTAQAVTVAPVDDAEVDGDQSYNVSMTVNASSTLDNTGYLALTLAPVAVTNADDDVAAPNSVNNPTQVVILPYAGTSVDPSTYYEVSGLTAGVTYNVSLTGLTGGVDLYVFDAAFAVQLCSSNQWDADDESCLATASTSSLWVRVDQDPTTWVGLPGGDFSLNLIAQ